MKLNHPKILLLITVVAMFIGFSQSAAAGVEVKFVEPDKFRDIDLSGFSKKRSIEHVQKDLTKLFQELAKDYVGEKENLSIEVTNIDLAGYIDYMRGDGNRDIRIVRNTDIYKLYFRFESKNEAGATTKQGEKKIREFLTHRPSRLIKNSHGSTVNYFEDDIKKWFKEEFAAN
ncbi:DUF3016 domain-containing protein [Aliikangiella coralliicola]|uniref:DUF3016 domain-containing protein n=1 Tax=Aliikangiella coralliicola TaxID=2592383 RepID=A0A545UDD7_9GAMM|nr:DUF3016 domain-containing protein [Aliikangiella coralliicola]TQV87484.1 DUF3016 domain-containing protein [Aliikangiella coralliicola]